MTSATKKISIADSLEMSFGLFSRGSSFVAAFMLCLSSAMAQAPSYAPYDLLSEHMRADTAPPTSFIDDASQPYFNRAIPQIIHVVDLHPDDAASVAWRHAWASYAQKFDYRVCVVRQHHLAAIKAKMSAGLREAFERSWRLGLMTDAENIIKWHVLWLHGGLIISHDIWPPQLSSGPIDFKRLFPMRNIVTVATSRPLNVRHRCSGLALEDLFVLAAAKHPLITQIIQSLPENVNRLRQAIPDIAPQYTSGSILLTRVMSGALTMLPALFLYEFELIRGAP